MAKVKVSVNAFSGGLMWGPASILDTQSILSLKRMVADRLQIDPYEVSLLYHDVALVDEASLAESDVVNDTMLSGVILDGVLEQGRLLARFLDQARSVEGSFAEACQLWYDDMHAREWRKAEDKDQGFESDPSSWLADIALSCDCGEAGLPRDLRAMLEAIAKCGKAFGQKSFVMSAREIKQIEQGCGLLCIESKSCETGFRRTLVDLTGELSGLFGKQSEHYKGTVWVSSVSEDTWDILADPFKINESSSISKWKDVIQYAYEKNMPELLPIPVAMNVREFFSMWLTTGVCPAFFQMADVMKARQEIVDLHALYVAVIEFRDAASRIAREREIDKTFKENKCVLHSIFSYLDEDEKEWLSPFEMRKLWEVGGWILPDSDETAVHNTFQTVCKEKGFDVMLSCSREAFVDCFMDMPLSADIRDKISCDFQELPTWCLEDFLATLVSGPNVGTHYLSLSKRSDLVPLALRHDVFNLLDCDCDGYLSSSEFRCFIEMAIGFAWEFPGFSDELVKPWMKEWVDEEHAVEVWQNQFCGFCEARKLSAHGLTEADFLKYLIHECDLTDDELFYFVNSNLRKGFPPMGHYISYGDFFEVVMTSQDVPLADAALDMGYDNAFVDAYEWCLECFSNASPRILQCASEGTDILTVPFRDRFPDQWKLLEASPRKFSWQLVQRQAKEHAFV